MIDYKTYKGYYQDPEFRKKIKEYSNSKVTCDCGVVISRSNMSHHKQTNKHKKWIDENGDKYMIEINRLKNRLENLENKDVVNI